MLQTGGRSVNIEHVRFSAARGAVKGPDVASPKNVTGTELTDRRAQPGMLEEERKFLPGTNHFRRATAVAGLSWSEEFECEPRTVEEG